MSRLKVRFSALLMRESRIWKKYSKKLKAWREPGVRFLVLRDNDGSSRETLKKRLVNLFIDSNRAETIVRLACQELEAWYFGDTESLAAAFQDESLKKLNTKVSFRDPDKISKPSAELSKLVADFQKISGARLMATYLNPSVNASP